VEFNGPGTLVRFERSLLRSGFGHAPMISR
jgi:hypothetical protein